MLNKNFRAKNYSRGFRFRNVEFKKVSAASEDMNDAPCNNFTQIHLGLLYDMEQLKINDREFPSWLSSNEPDEYP